jgi:hypothetical protein
MKPRLINPTEYLQLYKSTAKNVHLLNVHCTVKFLIDECFEGSVVQVYETVEGNNRLFTITLELLNGAW